MTAWRRRNVVVTLPTGEDAAAFMAIVMFATVGLIGLTNYEQQHNPTESKQTNQQPAPPPTAAEENQQERDSQGHGPEDETNHWYTDPDWILAVIGTFTFLFVGWQAFETRRSAEAARASIVLTHRPKLIVRNIEVPSLQDDSLSSSSLEGGTAWVTNTGGTYAKSIRFNMVWHIGDHLPARNPVLRPETRTRINSLSTGRSWEFDLPARALSPLEFAQISGAAGDFPEYGLYLIGIVKYFDDSEQLRRTSFCRRWDPKTKRFKVVRDSDYEHAD